MDVAARDLPVLEASAASVSYRSRNGTIEALRSLDLKVTRGEFVCVLGPSGCGKSTMLKLFAGLMQPTKGSVTVGGVPAVQASRSTGVVFQKATLLPWFRILDNVLLPIKAVGRADAQAVARARALLEMTGLARFETNYPFELSGGMQQRAAIARSLCHDPSLLLMDEPLAALDAMTREQMMIEIRQIWKKTSKSILFITHSIPEAVFLATRIVVLAARPGRVVRDFQVPLPDERTMDTMSSLEFGELCRELRSMFQDSYKGAS